MRKSQMGMWDLAAGLAIVLFLAGIGIAQRKLLAETQRRIECAVNLRMIAEALALYANENRGAYPRTVYDPNEKDGPTPKWGTPYEGHAELGASNDVDPFAKDGTPGAKYRPAANDVTAALYLLMRTQEIGSSSFVCPSTGAGKWEFGGGTNNALHWSNWNGVKTLAEHLSYSYANPYPSAEARKAGYKLNISLTPDFAVAADMNPGGDGPMKVTIHSAGEEMKKGNSLNHNGDGQNVLYGDGHIEFQNNPFVGVKRDNIYTYGPTDNATPGTGVVGSPAGAEDSVLLPTAKDLGITDFPNRPKDPTPLTMAGMVAFQKKNIGQYTQETPNGRETLTITDRQITIATQGFSATYDYDLAGGVEGQLIVAMKVRTGQAMAYISIEEPGLRIGGFAQLNGRWMAASK